MKTKTYKVRKSYVFLTILAMIAVTTGFSAVNLYRQLKTVSPLPVTDTENIRLIQLEAPPPDGKYAVISTDMGDMTAVLYTNEAPKAAEIFANAASSGSYDNVNVRLFEMGTIFTLEAPDGNIQYTAEISDNLWPFKGSLCMTENGEIIFVNTIGFSEEDKEYLSAEGELSQVRRTFLEQGGVPDYSRLYAVFGQVTEGIDILEAIANQNEDVRIIKIEIEDRELPI